jgi:hypothetical protein
MDDEGKLAVLLCATFGSAAAEPTAERERERERE